MPHNNDATNPLADLILFLAVVCVLSWIATPLSPAKTKAVTVLHIHKNGTIEYYFRNRRHRTNGPAIEYADGPKEWWHNGAFIRAEPARQ